MGGNPLDTNNGVIPNLWPMNLDPAMETGNPSTNVGSGGNPPGSSTDGQSKLPPGGATTGFGAVFAANG
jgi:hypothetical protein